MAWSTGNHARKISNKFGTFRGNKKFPAAKQDYNDVDEVNVEIPISRSIQHGPTRSLLVLGELRFGRRQSRTSRGHPVLASREQLFYTFFKAPTNDGDEKLVDTNGGNDLEPHTRKRGQ